MPVTLCAFNQNDWKRHGLADYGDFAEMVSECNMGEDAFSGFGEWFYVPDEPLPSGDWVIYFGSWGNDNSPGASMYMHAELFGPDEAAEFDARVLHWNSQPEYVETEDDEDGQREIDGDEDDIEHEEPWDEHLAQQEMEDFEQADEYFGGFYADEDY